MAGRGNAQRKKKTFLESLLGLFDITHIVPYEPPSKTEAPLVFEDTLFELAELPKEMREVIEKLLGKDEAIGLAHREVAQILIGLLQLSEEQKRILRALEPCLTDDQKDAIRIGMLIENFEKAEQGALAARLERAVEGREAAFRSGVALYLSGKLHVNLENATAPQAVGEVQRGEWIAQLCDSLDGSIVVTGRSRLHDIEREMNSALRRKGRAELWSSCSEGLGLLNELARDSLPRKGLYKSEVSLFEDGQRKTMRVVVSATSGPHRKDGDHGVRR